MSKELTEQERALVTHTAVYGMSVARAGALLQIDDPVGMISRSHVKEAVEDARRQLQMKTRITKEDVVDGLKEAIDIARTMADPTSMIRGWTEIAKLHDFYSPKRIQLQLSGTAKEIRKEIAQLRDDELLDQLGGEEEINDVIDGDFYRVEHG